MNLATPTIATSSLASAQELVRGDTNVELVFGIVLFTLAGTVFILAALFVGRLIRPQLDHPEKQAAYECGEPAVGDSWVQFDLRFYIVALFFIIFDVEIALLWPWAVIYRESVAAHQAGVGSLLPLYAMLFFLLPIVVGFAYEWRCGYLDWVRASTGQRSPGMAPADLAAEDEGAAPVTA